MAPNPLIMMANLGYLARYFTKTVCIMIGLGLFMGSLLTLKKYGETRTYMSHQMTLWGPMMMMLSAVLFLVMPTTISSVLFAFWGNKSPEIYNAASSDIDQYVPVVLMFVRLVGVGAIIRACILLSRMGGKHPAWNGR